MSREAGDQRVLRLRRACPPVDGRLRDVQVGGRLSQRENGAGDPRVVCADLRFLSSGHLDRSPSDRSKSFASDRIGTRGRGMSLNLVLELQISAILESLLAAWRLSRRGYLKLGSDRPEFLAALRPATNPQLDSARPGLVFRPGVRPYPALGTELT